MKALVVVLMMAFAASAESGWTDRGEYDSVMAIRSEASARKRVELLDAWKQKYPQSALAQIRLQLYLSAYQELGDSRNMLEAARGMIAAEPESFTGSYWCTVLVPEVKEAAPEVLDAGEKSARLLLANLDRWFVPPYESRKQRAGLLARRTLGWVAWQRGNYPSAETEFRRYLEKDPKSAEVVAWLGIVLDLQKDPAKASAGLWMLSRAGSVRGEGALPEGMRRQVASMADRLYATYHGDGEGLEQLRTVAAAGMFPPDGFAIESGAAVAARRADEELQRTNPALFTWVRIRRQLEGPDGEKYFAETLKPAPLPHLKGTVVSVSPASRPSEIVLAMDQPTSGDVLLRLDKPFSHAAEPGTVLEFEGTATSFEKQPFRLTVETNRDQISGWPEAGARRQ